MKDPTQNIVWMTVEGSGPNYAECEFTIPASRPRRYACEHASSPATVDLQSLASEKADIAIGYIARVDTHQQLLASQFGTQRWSIRRGD
ncbi:hypothetical protein AWB65_06272 [Caballeronia humi]|uniref:Uncharacterized protein n=1 Tax=Caballeronia humi TaxID=326474 RepID=A0A158JC77_9BURK|nr:hypothetical protein AWB65_06272 [Caballeronia humi]